MFKKKDETLEEAHAKARKINPAAADSALNSVKRMQEGKELMSRASQEALGNLEEFMVKTITRKGKMEAIEGNARLLGAMQALSEFIIPEVYNDMYKKFKKMGMEDIHIDMCANFYLGTAIANAMKDIEKANE